LKRLEVMLASYTRAINIQRGISGSLFRPKTKAECITKPEGITPSFFNTSYGSLINVQHIEKEYPQLCFNYIHNNPVKASLVKHPEEWEFSSYRDYNGMRDGKLIYKDRTDEFGIKW
jgi:putative transposase